MKPSNTLILFLKEPILGQVKTRLATSIGNKKTLEVYKEFLIMLSPKVHHDSWQTIVYYSGTQDPKFLQKTFGVNIPYQKQKGSNLGEKMSHAFKECFEAGAKKVSIIGGDSPDIPGSLIRDSFNGLKHCDVMVGPTTDGGYYLLGLKVYYPELFQNINWSTPSVYRETLSVIKSKNLIHSNLPIWNDIDTLEDFRIFQSHNPDFSIKIN